MREVGEVSGMWNHVSHLSGVERGEREGVGGGERENLERRSLSHMSLFSWVSMSGLLLLWVGGDLTALPPLSSPCYGCDETMEKK